MADNKRYYYLKLKDDFFETDSMVVLESMPDGYKYSNILLKLYLRSLKNEGKLMFNDRIPYNSTVLAQVTRHSVGDVERAINIFKELDLIEVLDNGAIFITDIQNFIGTSSTEADRKRAYRNRIENEKKLQMGQMSGQMSDKCPDKTPPELELEKELELEPEAENDKNPENQNPAAAQTFYENNFNYVTPAVLQDLDYYGSRFDEPNPIMIEAMEIAISRGVRKWNYAKSIIHKWYKEGLKTLEAVREFEIENDQSDGSKSKGRPKNLDYIDDL